ncbi:hypothetical protein K504DRAFT_493389 [Pleomassaria siparia CBS 279.74]|uniref:Uncharacterized protein n=1 Tax=Pleomassaria siparia CBS 279.74 TaxID=1314801 RepID=A0A6G1K099_9PLEO|nr:hypothetical protein K504DRAFT_493389 [Pleomassaria siparia CBS 279.74]
MPLLQGFSDNPFTTRAEFKAACISLLKSLQPYQSPGGARIRLPLVTGTHFDDVAAQLEGYARALWAVGALIHGGSLTQDETNSLIQPYVRGLANGTDPENAEYWGPVVVRDQRMVEMEIISFALLAAPDVMFHQQERRARENIAEWLGTINGKDFPVTNWLWFRVMTNLALVKVCGVRHEELRASMEEDLNQMEKFYLDEGWAADGIWDEQGRQADYYSGSFAIQFSQLLYVKMAQDLDPVRCEKFRKYAAGFATSFWRYFDANGAAIPFGRSLTYRFAFAGFWSAAAFAGVELPAPLNDWGVVKGLLLRHFRWWSDKHDVFNVDGTLTIGFTYPNMYMSEDYNSPQSPYWAMKSFISLGLPDMHAFWTTEERPLPTETRILAKAINPPMHITCNTGNHHFLLSAGQFCPWPLKATEAKYGKYAYSSHFGFSVPTGPLLPQMAPDSTLAVSKDGGDTWRVPWKADSHYFGEASLVQDGQIVETIPTLKSTWKPWKDADVKVSTTLIAPCRRWPDWYVRIHEVRSTGNGGGPVVQAVQGGFAIQGRRAKAGDVLPSFDDEDPFFVSQADTFPEGTLQSPHSGGALVCSSAGVSGIRCLDMHIESLSNKSLVLTEAEVLKPDANTNLIWQRTLIPTLRGKTKPLSGGHAAIFVTGVFAVSRKAGSEQVYDQLDLRTRWEDIPVLIRQGENPTGITTYIDTGLN